MDILLIFSEKPNTATKERAIRIAEKNEYFKDDKGRYKVIFKDISPDFINLLDISHPWRSTELFIDEKELKPSEVSEVLLCYNKNQCKGICGKVRIESFYQFSHLINQIKRIENEDIWDIVRVKSQLDCSDFFEKKSDDIYVIHKDKLKNEIIQQLDGPLKFCDRLKKDLMLQQIDELPDQFKIKPVKSYDDDLDVSCNDDVINKLDSFEGFSDYEKKEIKAKAEIEAPIFAKVIAKELGKIFVNNKQKK